MIGIQEALKRSSGKTNRPGRRAHEVRVQLKVDTRGEGVVSAAGVFDVPAFDRARELVDGARRRIARNANFQRSVPLNDGAAAAEGPVIQDARGALRNADR